MVKLAEYCPGGNRAVALSLDEREKPGFSIAGNSLPRRSDYGKTGNHRRVGKDPGFFPTFQQPYRR